MAKHLIPFVILCFGLCSYAAAPSFAQAIDDGKRAVMQRDFAKAADIYTRLEANGDKEAAFQLGVLYKMGQGVPRDLKKAFALVKKSAESGIAPAQYALGEFYENGWGTDADDAKAMLWYRKADNSGDPQASKKIEYLTTKGFARAGSASVNDSLVESAGLGDLNAVERALKAGAKVNYRDIYGHTALFDAVYRDRPDVIKFLLRNGADTGLANKDGDAPLMIAAGKSSLAAVQLLVGAKADVNVTDKNGYSPLMRAIAAKKSDVALFLIRSGADVTYRNKQGKNALDIAHMRHTDDVKAALLATGKVTMPKDIKASPKAIEAAAQRLSQGESEWPPLILAAWRGQGEIVTAFLQKGADANALAPDGYSALARAAWKGDVTITDSLIRAGTKLTTQKSEDNSPLIAAARGGNPDVVRYLLQYQKYNIFPLSTVEKALAAAIESEKPASIPLLMDEAQRFNIAAKSGLGTFLLLAAEKGSPELIDLAVKRGGSLHAADQYGQTPLMVAVEFNKGTTVRKILELDPSVKDDQDAKGQTALFYALKSGNLPMEEVLVAAGTNLNLQDKEGNSAFMTAVALRQTTLAESYLKRGATVDLTNKKGERALTIAVQNNDMPMTELLLKNGANAYYPLTVVHGMPQAFRDKLAAHQNFDGWVHQVFGDILK